MLQQAGVFAFVGLEFVVAVLLGYWVGKWADEELATAPWLMTVGIAIGFLSVCWTLYMTLRRMGGLGSTGPADNDPQESRDDE